MNIYIYIYIDILRKRLNQSGKLFILWNHLKDFLTEKKSEIFNLFFLLHNKMVA